MKDLIEAVRRIAVCSARGDHTRKMLLTWKEAEDDAQHLWAYDRRYSVEERKAIVLAYANAYTAEANLLDKQL